MTRASSLIENMQYPLRLRRLRIRAAMRLPDAGKSGKVKVLVPGRLRIARP